MEMVALFENILQSCMQLGNCASISKIQLAAHHIVVQGQMWAFRRWALQKKILTRTIYRIANRSYFQRDSGTVNNYSKEGVLNICQQSKCTILNIMSELSQHQVFLTGMTHQLISCEVFYKEAEQKSFTWA